MQHLPTTSATAHALTGIPREWNSIIPWLLEWQIQALSGEPYPGRPDFDSPEEKRESRKAALLDHKRRMEERDRELAIEST